MRQNFSVPKWTSTKWFRALSVLILTALACVIVAGENGVLPCVPNEPRPYPSSTNTYTNTQPSQQFATGRINKTPTIDLQPQSTPPQPDKCKKFQDWLYKWLEPIVIVTTLVLIVYARQLAQMIKSANAARDSADAARRYAEIASDTAVRQLRAYLHVSSAALTFGDQRNTPSAVINIENCGQTPAYGVRSWIGIQIGPYPTAGLPGLGRQPTAPATLGRGGHVEKAITLDNPVPPNVVPLLGTMTHTIFVYGEIHYRDVYDKKWFTKYRFIYGGPSHIREGRLATDIEGNEAT